MKPKKYSRGTSMDRLLKKVWVQMVLAGIAICVLRTVSVALMPAFSESVAWAGFAFVSGLLIYLNHDWEKRFAQLCATSLQRNNTDMDYSGQTRQRSYSPPPAQTATLAALEYERDRLQREKKAMETNRRFVEACKSLGHDVNSLAIANVVRTANNLFYMDAMNEFTVDQ